MPIPPGWSRSDVTVGGVPLWRHDEEGVYAATRDLDQLLCIDAALRRFADMTADEFHRFVTT